MKYTTAFTPENCWKTWSVMQVATSRRSVGSRRSAAHPTEPEPEPEAAAAAAVAAAAAGGEDDEDEGGADSAAAPAAISANSASTAGGRATGRSLRPPALPLPGEAPARPPSLTPRRRARARRATSGRPGRLGCGAEAIPGRRRETRQGVKRLAGGGLVILSCRRSQIMLQRPQQAMQPHSQPRGALLPAQEHQYHQGIIDLSCAPPGRNSLSE